MRHLHLYLYNLKISSRLFKSASFILEAWPQNFMWGNVNDLDQSVQDCITLSRLLSRIICHPDASPVIENVCMTDLRAAVSQLHAWKLGLKFVQSWR